MPRELVAVAPRQPVIREYREPSLGHDQVRIVSEFSAPKHGTELGMYRDTSPLTTRRYDDELKLFRGGENLPSRFPRPLGNMSIGIINEAGSAVKRFKVGDRVFGHLPIRETHTVSEDKIEKVPDGMSPQSIVYWDPAEFALGAVRDADVRLGERVAVFGLGAIGLMTVQMAKLSGAILVIAVDPIPLRRELALKHGADIAFDPKAVDAGVEIKLATGKKGVDVAIEASGSYQALHEAIRSTHLGGLVVPLAFYQGEAKGLRLGEEWHINRITMRSSRSISDPNRDHPMWDSERIKEVSFQLLKEGKLSVEGLIRPIVKFEESADAYRLIDEHPEEVIKLGVVYK
jgi:threonine dehydrogenase-like Zn-dependent dehydrogenase